MDEGWRDRTRAARSRTAWACSRGCSRGCSTAWGCSTLASCRSWGCYSSTRSNLHRRRSIRWASWCREWRRSWKGKREFVFFSAWMSQRLRQLKAFLSPNPSQNGQGVQNPRTACLWDHIPVLDSVLLASCPALVLPEKNHPGAAQNQCLVPKPICDPKSSAASSPKLDSPENPGEACGNRVPK